MSHGSGQQGKKGAFTTKIIIFRSLRKYSEDDFNTFAAALHDVPHRFIRETMTGKKEEVPEIPEKKETVLGVVKVDFDAEEFRQILQETVDQIEEKFEQTEDEAEQEQEAPEKEPPEVTAESILAAAEETTRTAAEETACRG